MRHLVRASGCAGVDTYQGPPESLEERQKLNVAVDPSSNRLQLLTPFKPWHGDDLRDCAVLIKAGVTLPKCTPLCVRDDRGNVLPSITFVKETASFFPNRLECMDGFKQAS
eukprot:scaffold115581_cov13-Tisochrysis_lutea.AAC.1